MVQGLEAGSFEVVVFSTLCALRYLSSEALAQADLSPGALAQVDLSSVVPQGGTKDGCSMLFVLCFVPLYSMLYAPCPMLFVRIDN